MTPDVLHQLRDLKMPKTIGVWPLAYGWYILFFLILIIFASLLIWRYKHYLKNRPKQAALKELEQIKTHYLKDRNTAKTATALTSLLKRFCLSYHTRNMIAPLFGDKFVEFLGHTTWGQILTTISYQRKSDVDLMPFFDDIAKWIKGKRYV